MTRRIFRAVCTAALTVFVVTMVLIFGALYSYFSGVQQKQLSNETALAVQGAEQMGADFFEGLPISGYRITWISADGTVLYDSASDSGAMENHLERKEIQEALASGHGESSRYSATLMVRSLYCAQRLTDGTILRLSVAHGSVLLMVLGMLQPIILIVAVAAILAFVLASRLSKRIVAPMNRLNLDEPLENDGYEELTPLLRRIYSQQQQLALQSANLRQKKQELHTIIGNMEEGMVLLDAANRVISMNRAAEVLLNVSPMHGGRNMLELTANRELQEAVQTAAAGTSCTRQTRLQGKTVQISAAPVQTERAVSGTAIVLFDITQQEQAEQRRREFTANVSHELKTPLQSISGYSELLMCGIAKAEDVQPFSEKIHSEAKRLMALVEDIINLSHLDEGGTDLRWTDVELYAAARQVVQRLEEITAQKEITLSLEGETSVVRAVPELVQTMLYNLCDNAIKYNRPGGSVTVAVHDHTVTVRDTGIGIPPEHLDRIFERFYRVDKSHSKEVGGTGLGLSIVKHASLIQNAKIEVESTVDSGTEIRVTFPE